jgi:hypothetical protein
MTNLGNRIQMIENAINNMPGGSNEVMMFFRPDPYHPDKQTPKEIKWREENPDFKGIIHINTFGIQNPGLQHQSSSN